MEQESEQEQQLTKNQRRKLKKEQKQAEKEAIQRKRLMKKSFGFVVLFAVFIGAMWGGVQLAQRSEASKPGEKVASQGNEHIELGDDHIDYNTTPPTSGPHAGTARWGNHISQISDESQIHNLEDGGIGIQYDCDKNEGTCAELIDQLLGVMVENKDKIFMGPYEGIGNRIALTAWQRIDKFDDFDKQRIVDFIDEYKDIDHHVGGGG